MVKNKNQLSKPVIEIKEMHKWFGNFHVLKNISLGVNQGDRIVICGPSGSGKSTLIRCINRLEVHQKGDIIVNGTELTGDLKNLEAIRSDVGMVFQSFNLFPHLTVLENCTLAPIWVKGLPKKEANELAMELLTRVKIPEQALKFPGQLSGGQQQRVAIARALLNDPELILADEPTGNLDPKTSIEVMNLLNKIHQSGKSILMATHDYALIVKFKQKTLKCEGGELFEVVAQTTP